MFFSEDQLEQYSRQFVLREIGVAGQKQLLQSKVLVIGAGALGSSALLYLAAAGVGTIGIADYDRVERSNLHRQVIHGTESIGMEKVLSAKQAIEARNPDVTVVPHLHKITVDNIQSIIGDYDIILDCTDRFETKFLINDACVLSQKPYVHGGAVRFEGQVMTYLPGQGPCLRCLLEQVPPREETAYCSEVGVLGAVTGVIGSVQALEAVKHLVDIGELLVGKVLRFDGLQMEMRVSKMPHADPECGVCGNHPTITALAENRAEYDTENGCRP